MGAFKGVGYPKDIGAFYRICDYDAWAWTAHGRFPTNTPGWWGGAHPFTLLNWSVVHNGEISSYDANRRYVEHVRLRLRAADRHRGHHLLVRFAEPPPRAVAGAGRCTSSFRAGVG